MVEWAPSDEVDGTIRDLVLLYLPDPAGAGGGVEQRELADEVLNDARNQLYEELTQQAEALEASSSDRNVEVDADGDPVGEWDDLPTQLVLGELDRWARSRAEASANITLLLAYARDFVDDPPPLARLARIVAMSVSGVRTAYGDRERAELAARLRRAPVRGALAPVWRGESSPHGFLLGVDEFGSWVSVPLADASMLQLDAPATDPTVRGITAVLRGQAQAAGWTVREMSETELIEAARAHATDPSTEPAGLGFGGPALLEIGEQRARASDPTAKVSTRREDYAAVAAVLAKHPQTHLVWPGVSPADKAAFGDQPILRSPGRRHEQFWVLETPGRAPQQVRPARVEQRAGQ